MDGSALIRRVPLFAGLDDRALDDLLRIFEPVVFAAGENLTRQGGPARCAYVIESGHADVLTLLPGGGSTRVAQLQAGNVLGEMALLDNASCSATVTACEAMACHRITREGFRLLLAQRVPAVFEIQQRITRGLCQRLRLLNAKVVAADAAGPPAVAAPVPSAGDMPPDDFDHRAFLPVLPPFRDFEAADLDALCSASQVVHLQRGELLFEQGSASDACYIVVRGALELTVRRDGLRHRIGILGPGRLCGIMAMIEGQAHSMQAAAREQAVLLAMDRADFEVFFAGCDRVSAKLQQVMHRELLQALARTNNHLTRLISSARVRGAPVADLEQALRAQDCRVA